MSEHIVGRKREIESLEEVIKSKRPEFVAVHGRRRIGKTFLIKEFFIGKDIIFLRTTGIKDAKLKNQIRHVTDEIGKTFYNGLSLTAKDDWFGTFELLSTAIKEVKNKKPIVIFFDELPWMVTRKSMLLQALDHYWNHVWSNDKRIKLIICGSSSAWIVENIINNKGGLHNRVTKTIRLEAFTLNETEKYLSSIGIKLSRKHISEIYMVMGGVPYYLSCVPKGQSSKQVISELSFNKDGLLVKEFNNLYSSLFKDADTYIDLLRIISGNRHGVAQVEVIKKSKYHSKGGRIVKKLKELEESGFIISFIPYRHERQGIYYRVIDEYTLFYFYWISAIRSKLSKMDMSRTYWQTVVGSQSWKVWSGLAFEAVCYKHLSQIRKALNVDPGALIDSWRYAPREDSKKGAQIDLLFDAPDNSIALCEIKYTDAPFSISKQYADTLVERMEIFKKVTKTEKQLFLSFISSSGIKLNSYSSRLVSKIATLEDLFAN